MKARLEFEMPKCCFNCPCCWEGALCCKAVKEDYRKDSLGFKPFEYKFDIWEGKPDWCPLQEVEK
jgi:hypothetical protein